MNTKQPKAWYKKWWIWVIVIVILITAASTASNPPEDQSNQTSDSTTQEKDTKTETQKPVDKKPDVPAEYLSALSQADTYANDMHLSKQGLYDQLTSEYGGQFSAKAAKYAINNVKADWKANALAKAKDYQEQQHLSPEAIRDQLTSDYGEKFTQAEADYAIAHLND